MADDRRTARAVLCAVLLINLCSPAARGQVPLNTCRIEGVAVRCGTVPVPEDHGRGQNARRIGLRVVVLPALAGTRNPPLFVINGGPGAATVDMAALFLDELAPLRAARDIVLVDQRGTGGSNALRCRTARARAIVPDDARGCLRELSRVADLRLYGTEHAVRDLDHVRAVLGYDRIDIAGFSYGTRVAWSYAKTFPAHLRSVVMVSPNPPSHRLLASLGEDSHRALRLIAADCRAAADCGNRFPAFEEELKRVIETLTPAQRMALPLLLYSVDGARRLPWMVNRAAGGDRRPLEQALSAVLAAARGQISLGLYLTVQCSEEFAPNAADIREPLAAALTSEYAAACHLWPRVTPPAGFRDPFTSDARALIISGEWDPATPPRWAEETARTFPKSTLVVIPKGTHGLSDIGDCLGAVTARFLSGEAIDPRCVGALATRGFFLGSSSN
jgi:pimeloyl-ACP methyl ester carboxylesterase